MGHVARSCWVKDLKVDLLTRYFSFSLSLFRRLMSLFQIFYLNYCILLDDLFCLLVYKSEIISLDDVKALILHLIVLLLVFELDILVFLSSILGDLNYLCSYQLFFSYLYSCTTLPLGFISVSFSYIRGNKLRVISYQKKKRI